MSTLKINRVQFGQSGTATNNFTVTAEAADGTIKLARGNAGAITQDIITVATDGKVNFPAGLSTTYTPIGVGQVWTNMTSVRAFGQDYTNDTGRPITIAVTGVIANSTNSISLVVSGIVVHQIGAAVSNLTATVSGIIPPGASYRVNVINAGLSVWAELR